MVKNPTRRATRNFVIGSGIAAIGAAISTARLMRTSRPGTAVWAKLWLALCILSVIAIVLRFIYYRNRRDYFAEEMDHRRSLAKGLFKVKN